MTRKTIDCRTTPSETACTLTLSGEEGEVLAAAVHHAVAVHGHADDAVLRTLLRDALTDDIEMVSNDGAFVQLFEFRTNRIEEWNAIQDRFAATIGADRTTRWSILGADRDRPDTYLAIVEFPSHEAAMANSDNPATAAFLSELTAICQTKPEFHNLDVLLARPY
jgi:quinol monooxygenase YgiN